MSFIVLILMVVGAFSPAHAQGRDAARAAPNPGDLTPCAEDRACWGLQQDDCSPSWVCDTDLGVCVVNPVTVITCPTTDDTDCMKNTCNPRSGACELTPVNVGGSCSDGDACTHDDTCQRSGTCTGQWSPASYPDSSTCQCQSDAHCGAFEDGDACNGLLYCDTSSGQCVVNPATVVSCPSGADTACATNQCDPATGSCGMAPANEGDPCGDGNPCYLDGACVEGTCIQGDLICECQDDVDCPDDDLCNPVYCDKALGECVPNPAEAVPCPAGQTCDPSTGDCG